jgi:hypothetical protein
MAVDISILIYNIPACWACACTCPVVAVLLSEELAGSRNKAVRQCRLAGPQYEHQIVKGQNITVNSDQQSDILRTYSTVVYMYCI